MAPAYPIKGCFSNLGEDALIGISSPLSSVEVHKALFGMQPWKAPGLDGFHTSFHQRYWDIISDAICSEVCRVIGGVDIDSGMAYFAQFDSQSPSLGLSVPVSSH